ncbi:hypothetical protein ETAA8_54480 [Anatilimnocola aggregata]|uniref:Uncharacterized protein n=2 Tax=Anatilimnocola aggregata TaxID=2528021 RepID=A0A517YJD4_9BACT|nr:hypothetical protein ETAA8_54480 [Anatilimnocola aggregata]
MVRSDVVKPETVDIAEAAPVRDLSEVLNQIQVDAKSQAAEYLHETEVPYGGE